MQLGHAKFVRQWDN